MKFESKTMKLKQVLEAAARAADQVSTWPEWKRELSTPAATIKAATIKVYVVVIEHWSNAWLTGTKIGAVYTDEQAAIEESDRLTGANSWTHAFYVTRDILVDIPD